MTKWYGQVCAGKRKYNHLLGSGYWIAKGEILGCWRAVVLGRKSVKKTPNSYRADPQIRTKKLQIRTEKVKICTEEPQNRTEKLENVQSNLKFVQSDFKIVQSDPKIVQRLYETDVKSYRLCTILR